MTSWQTPLCPFTIGFAAEKLDEIRIAVVDGFYKVPRGGVEIGGVLFGKRKTGWLSITNFRIIETEYLRGPSFQLSAEDREGLRQILAEKDLDDPKIEALGLFVSHTRSKICLSEKDLELYNEFFAEPWQVALVLKPENLGQVRAGYFFRAESGAVQTDASVLEFVVEPRERGKPGANLEDGSVTPVPAPRKLAFAPVELATVAVSAALPVEPAIVKPPQHVPEKPLPLSPVQAAEKPPEPAIPLPSPASITAAVPHQDPLLFQFIGQGRVWGWKSILYVLLAIAAVLSAFAGYWLATRGNQ